MERFRDGEMEGWIEIIAEMALRVKNGHTCFISLDEERISVMSYLLLRPELLPGGELPVIH